MCIVCRGVSNYESCSLESCAQNKVSHLDFSMGLGGNGPMGALISNFWQNLKESLMKKIYVLTRLGSFLVWSPKCID